MEAAPSSSVLARDDRRRARRLLILESALASGQSNLTSGVVLLGYALFLGANTFQIGLLSTAQMLGSALQLAADALLRRMGTRRKLGSAALAALAAARMLMGLLPLAAMWIAAQHLVWGLLSALILASGAAQIAEVVRLAWIAEVVPEHRRGRFLGDRQLLSQLAASLVAITAAWIIDWQRLHSLARGTLTAQGFFVLAGALGVVNIFVLRSIPEPPMRLDASRRGWTILAEPFKDRRFRPLMIHYALWHFFAPFGGAFFNLYLIEVLKMPLGVVAFYTFIGQVANLYSVRLWGRMADRFGNLPVLRICVAAKALFPLLWAMLWPASGGVSRVLVYLMAGWIQLWRTFNSGQNLATVNLALRLMPEGGVTGYLATFRTFGNWIHAVSPALGGLLATALQHSGWSVRGSLALLFALSALGRYVSLLSLRWVREPHAASLRRMWGIMRRVPGVTTGRGWRAWLRFWGGPLWTGFIMARVRLGRLIAHWQGRPPVEEG